MIFSSQEWNSAFKDSLAFKEDCRWCYFGKGNLEKLFLLILILLILLMLFSLLYTQEIICIFDKLF